jgi:hypothetical protein
MLKLKNVFKFNFTNFKKFSTVNTVNGCLISYGFNLGDLHEASTCNISMSKIKEIKRKYISFDLYNEGSKSKSSILEESSRIMREDIKDISKINISKLDVWYNKNNNVLVCDNSWWENI